MPRTGLRTKKPTAATTASTSKTAQAVNRRTTTQPKTAPAVTRKSTTAASRAVPTVHNRPPTPRKSRQTSVNVRQIADIRKLIVNELAQTLGNTSLNATITGRTTPPPQMASTPAPQRAQQAIRYDYEDPIPDPNPIQTKRYFGLFCEKFSGKTGTDSIEINEWLKVFERLTRRFPDEDRIDALGRHLTDDALKWFAIDDICDLNEWDAVREAMMNRFTRIRTLGLAEAADRRLKTTETVEQYYNDMRRLLLKAHVSDAGQVELLTKGMPDSYRIQISALQPKTPQQWLSIAINIEEAKRKRYVRQEVATHSGKEIENKESMYRIDQRKDQRNYSRTQPNSDLPAEPCPHCLRRYRLTEYHWKRVCPRLKPTHTEQTTTQADTGLTEQNNTTPTITFISDGFVYYDIEIDDKKVRAFLDSGSTLTAISLQTAKRLKLIPDPRTSITIRHVNGTAPTVGRIEPILKIGDKSMKFPIHVFDNISQDALLGIDAAKAFGLKVDFGSVSSTNTGIHQIFSSTIEKLNASTVPNNETKAVDATEHRFTAISCKPVVSTVDIDLLVQRQDEIKAYNLKKPIIVNGLTVVHYRGIDRQVVPPSLVPELIRNTDNNRHLKPRNLIRMLAPLYWWPTRDKDVYAFVKACNRCRAEAQSRVIGSQRKSVHFRSNDNKSPIHSEMNVANARRPETGRSRKQQFANNRRHNDNRNKTKIQPIIAHSYAMFPYFHQISEPDNLPTRNKWTPGPPVLLGGEMRRLSPPDVTTNPISLSV